MMTGKSRTRWKNSELEIAAQLSVRSGVPYRRVPVDDLATRADVIGPGHIVEVKTVAKLPASVRKAVDQVMIAHAGLEAENVKRVQDSQQPIPPRVPLVVFRESSNQGGKPTRALVVMDWKVFLEWYV
jgi:hypothetical protein